MNTSILIVEDSAHIQASLISLIEYIPGVRSIYTAHSLETAMQCLQRCVPMLIVLDLQLPDGIGTELIGPFKLMVPTTQIAVLTNHASEFNKRHCLAGGADWFFDKSTEFDDLLDVVRHQAAIA